MNKLPEYKLSDWSLDNLNDLQIISEFDKTKFADMVNISFNNEEEFLNRIADILNEKTVYSNRENFIKFSNPDKYYEESNDDSDLPPQHIVAYTELRSCADLVRMYNNGKGKLIIQPDFQRAIVWDNASQTRFVDCLTKQLPIPSLCFSLDYKTQKRLVIDGLQRIQSIINFLTDDNWRLSKLDDIDSRLAGKKVSEIRKQYPGIIEIVENVTLPITVLRCDYSKESHNNYLFTIFHRLNSGGKKLTNQEIRNCIYQGTLNDLLKENCQYPNWRNLLHLKIDNSYRFKYEEYILRFYAFYDNLTNYKGSLAKFLNSYMSKNKNLKAKDLEFKKELFRKTIDILFQKVMEGKAIEVNNTIMESLIIGIAQNLELVTKQDNIILQEKYRQLLEDDNFSEENLRGGLANTDKLKKRLNTSIQIFSQK